MNDRELKEISRDPRFAGRLKKKTRKEKEAHKSLFEGIEEEETFKDKRGKPWSCKPLRYAKHLLEKEEDDESESESEEYEADESEESSSSDSDSSVGGKELDPEERLIDLQDADWFELVKDAEPAEEETRRLAVLHFDWDNSNAKTLFLALESFLPPGSTLDKVTIYPSEYGMKKMEEEERHGPKDIWVGSGVEEEEDQEDEVEVNRNPVEMDADEKKAWSATSIKTRRRLRQYQLQRLKYYYAIAEFDSKETAAAIYQACNDVEFADTGIRFDLRFVPDSMTFSVPNEWAHAVSECCEVNRAKYKPRTVENTALHSTRITLSWDRTPTARTQWLREQFAEDADPKKLFSEGKAQLSEYVALSSSGQSTAAPSDVDEPGPAPTVPRIHKHRPRKVPPEELRAALLSGLKGRSGDESVEDEEKLIQYLSSHFSDLGVSMCVANLKDHSIFKGVSRILTQSDYRSGFTRNKKSDGEGGHESDDTEDEEVGEEVYDLDDSEGCKGADAPSEDGSYDLNTTDDEKSAKKRSKNRISSKAFAKGGRKTVSKRYLPEAIDGDNSDDDSSLDFDDMDRASDDGTDEFKGGRKKRRLVEEVDSINDEDSKETKRKKKKLAMRKKMQLKKQKQEKNREKLKELWTGANENDSRFDIFLTDPTFGVSQMHKEYKEAAEFLNFMRRRRGPLLAAKKGGGGVRNGMVNN
nr:ESF1 [Hymenolepis microstoma]